MDRENGSLFKMNIKLIYTDWIRKENFSYPLPNANLGYLNGKAIKRAAEIEIDEVSKSLLTDLLHHDSVSFCQIHDYFYKIWTTYYGTKDLISLDQVDLDSDTIYLYVIELDYSNDSFVNRKYTNDNGEEITYHMLNQIPQEIYALVRRNKGKIIFSWIDNKCFEGHLKSAEIRFKLMGVPLENIIFLSGNINLDYKGKLKQKTALCSIRDIAQVMACYPGKGSLGYVSDYVRISDLDKNKFRNKRFLSWNRSINRSHRYALLYFVKKHNLFDSGYFSFLNSFNICHDCLKYFYNWPKYKLDMICEGIESLIPYEIDTFTLTDEGRYSFRTIDNNKKEIYLDSYIHIVSETQFKDNRTPYITEKTFRPIMNLQPFIMMNNAGTLKRVKELGFKTFHPFIDESYDDETNSQLRWEMIQEEILKFYHMPLEELHEWYYSIQDILVYNQQHLLTFKDYNILEDCLKEIINGH